ncbi:MAG: patatin-like phospholipase family protein [Halocynthiibacter sp.]
MTHAKPISRKQRRTFALVFSGGGARGFSHAGVLKALVEKGYLPSAIVGVSMGAVVAATYTLNPNWFRDLVEMDISGFPASPDFRQKGITSRLKNIVIAQRAARDMYFGWGTGARTENWGRSVLRSLTMGKNLQDGHIPVFVSSTDMLSGKRVVRDRGLAADYVYASAALAGILPPFIDGPHVLMDGAYADIAPIDVARKTGVDAVIVVDPAQQDTTIPPSNGIQAMLRSVEICQNEHARLRFGQADLVITPEFGQSIGVLDFQHKRHCIAAGIFAVRRAAGEIRECLIN